MSNGFEPSDRKGMRVLSWIMISRGYWARCRRFEISGLGDEPLLVQRVFISVMSCEAARLELEYSRTELVNQAAETINATELHASDDEMLARAAQTGDHLAFAELYRRYFPVFAAYAERRLRTEGSDVVQSAFLSIYRGLARYRGPRFFSWAYRICVNAVTDELRKKRVRRVECLSTNGDPDDLSSPTPEEELIAKRLNEQLNDTLAELPASHRTVFLLARTKGMSYAEIGELLGIPEGTVKSRMFNAVRALYPEGDVR